LNSQAGDRYKYIEVNGFLRLPIREPRQRVQSSRDIMSTARDSQDSDSEEDEVEDSESDASDTIPLTSRQENLKALEAQLSTDPTSVNLWLLLLSHTTADISPDVKNAQKVRAEISLSVLSRALAAHPGNAQSQQLRLKYLNAGEEIWTAEGLNSEWEAALQIGSTELWIRWLDWRIRVALKGFDGIIEDAQRALAFLSREDEKGRLRAFWRITIALRDAGKVINLTY
jgi:hypothetical protein